MASTNVDRHKSNGVDFEGNERNNGPEGAQNRSDMESLSNEELDCKVIGDGTAEGGWGWMVVMASFCNTFILDGIGGGFGLLYPYILDKYKSTALVTSFAGSLFVSYMMMGSFAAVLADNFGFRRVAITGGILCSISIISAAFCTNVYIFVLAFGLLAGCSTGLVYLPSVVIVNRYFSKKRGIANGIVSSGAGAGLVILAPIISLLLSTYSLEGTILILGGFALNMTVFSCLFRPPFQNSYSGVDVDSYSNASSQHLMSPETERVSYVALSNEQNDKPITDSGPSNRMTSGKICTESFEGQKGLIANADAFKSHPFPACNIVDTQILYTCHDKPLGSVRERNSHNLFTNLPWGSDHRLHVPSHRTSELQSEITAHHSVDNVAHLLLRRQDIKIKHIDHRNRIDMSPYDRGSSLFLAGSLTILQNSQNRFLQRSHASSVNTLPSQLHINDEHCKSIETKNSKIELNDALINGHLEDEENSITINIPHSFDGTTKENPPIDESQGLTVFSEEHKTINLTLKDLLVRPAFDVFVSGACFIQIGYPVIGTFLADYAQEQGLSSDQSAFIMSVMGFFNIIGRLMAGALASLGLDPLRLHNLMLFLGSVSCLLFPLYTSFWSLCIFAALFGLLLGFFPPLQPLIIVEYFGLASLGSAFGFLSMMKGLATMLGPPMAGWVYDSCHDYAMSIIFAGSAFLLSSIIHQTMTCFERY